MFFGKRNRSTSAPISMAAHAGFAVAVQVLPALAGERPRLALAQVQSSDEGSAQSRLEGIARHIRLRRKVVRVLLDRSEYQLLQVEAPSVQPDEMRAAVRWQVKDMLRLPMDQVTLDVAPPPLAPAGGRRAMAYVAAASNDIVRERMLGFRVFSSDVDVIDIPEMAQRNIADQLEEAGRATAVLSVSATGCLLTASREGTLYFTRHFDLTGGISDNASERSEQLDKLVLDLQRSIDVLEHQFSFLSVSTLWLAPFAYADELLPLLIEHLYLPSRLIDLTSLFDCSACALPSLPTQHAAMFHVLGLALRPSGDGA